MTQEIRIFSPLLPQRKQTQKQLLTQQNSLEKKIKAINNERMCVLYTYASGRWLNTVSCPHSSWVQKRSTWNKRPKTFREIWSDIEKFRKLWHWKLKTWFVHHVGPVWICAQRYFRWKISSGWVDRVHVSLHLQRHLHLLRLVFLSFSIYFLYSWNCFAPIFCCSHGAFWIVCVYILSHVCWHQNIELSADIISTSWSKFAAACK